MNGVLDSPIQTLGSFYDTNESDLHFGVMVGVPTYPSVQSAFLNGQIDEVAIFNRALSAAEILANFNADSAGNCKLTPSFTNLSSPSIFFSSGPTNLSGNISAGVQSPPAAEIISVTLNGVTQTPLTQADGSFSTNFATDTLPVSAPYAISYSYAGDLQFSAASGTGALTVNKATPSFSNLSSPSIF